MYNMTLGVVTVTGTVAWQMGLETRIHVPVMMREMDRGTHGAHHCSIGRHGESDIDHREDSTHRHSSRNRLGIMVEFCCRTLEGMGGGQG